MGSNLPYKVRRWKYLEQRKTMHNKKPKETNTLNNYLHKEIIYYLKQVATEKHIYNPVRAKNNNSYIYKHIKDPGILNL